MKKVIKHNSFKDKHSELIIWAGAIIGVADWITDIAFIGNVKLYSIQIRSACIAAIILQPIIYILIMYR